MVLLQKIFKVTLILSLKILPRIKYFDKVLVQKHRLKNVPKMLTASEYLTLKLSISNSTET